MLMTNNIFVLNLQKKAGGRKDEMTCKFAKENGSEVCDLSHRKKISLAEIKASYPEQYKSAKSHHFQKIYRSDYINVMVSCLNTMH